MNINFIFFWGGGGGPWPSSGSLELDYDDS